MVAAIPMLCAAAWARGEFDRVRRATIVVISLAAGVLLALYLERWATGMETELFAGAALGLYVLTLVRPPRRAPTAMFLRSLLPFHFWVQFTESRLFGFLVFSLLALFPVLPRRRTTGADAPWKSAS